MNYDHKAFRELITGMSGSGKSTLWLAAVKKHRARWKFIFDPEREAARKLGFRAVIDEPRMVQALAVDGLVCFDSSRLFPGERREGFAFFCRWVMNVSKALKGTKLIACDELQSVQRTGDNGLPRALKEITDEGRREEIDCLFAAQRLNEINDDIRGQLTAITTLKHDDPLALWWLKERGFDVDAVRALPVPGGWIRRNDKSEITTNVRRPAHPSRKTGGATPLARGKA